MKIDEMSKDQCKRLLGVYDNLKENEMYIELMDFIDKTIIDEGRLHFTDEIYMLSDTEREKHYLKVAALEMVKADMLTFLEATAGNLRRKADAKA